MRTLAKGISISIVVFLAMIECSAQLPHYIFVLPDGYVGWIQIVFDSPGDLPMVLHHGSFILRVDKSGVLKTSSIEQVFAGSHDQFFYSRHNLKGKEVWSAIPSNYFCGEESGIDSCYGAEGTKSDGFTVERANLGQANDGTPGNSWFLFVGPPDLRAKMAKPIHRAPGEKYQIDVPQDDPHPGMINTELKTRNY